MTIVEQFKERFEFHFSKLEKTNPSKVLLNGAYICNLLNFLDAMTLARLDIDDIIYKEIYKLHQEYSFEFNERLKEHGY